MNIQNENAIDLSQFLLQFLKKQLKIENFICISNYTTGKLENFQFLHEQQHEHL